MNFIEVTSITNISLFVLLGAFLVFNEKRKSGMKWLGFFFLLLSINFLDGLLLLNGVYFDFPSFALWEDGAVLLYGPFILFFTNGLTAQPTTPSKKYLHLVPFFSMEILILFGFHLQPDETRQTILLDIVEFRQPNGVFIGLIILFIHVFLYLYFSRRRLSEYKANLKAYYSSVDLSWLFSLLNFTILLFTISLGASIISFFGGKFYYQITLTLLGAVSTVLVFRLIIKAMNTPLLRETPSNRYDSGLSLDAENALLDNITKWMESNKAYRDPAFTIKDLSDGLGENSRVVSHVINKLMGSNFYDFVNEYRIDDAKSIFSSADSKVTVLEVMYEVGFNSKSSFNVQFKNKTGMTPSQYKASLRN